MQIYFQFAKIHICFVMESHMFEIFTIMQAKSFQNVFIFILKNKVIHFGLI